MVRPRRRPRVAGRGVGIPQGRQCSLSAGSDRRQGMRNQFTIPPSSNGSKGKQYWMERIRTKSNDECENVGHINRAYYSRFKTIGRISYARSVTQPRLWCTKQRIVFSINAQRWIFFSLSAFLSISFSSKRIEIGLFTVWLADDVNQWNHVLRYYLSKGRRNWMDAC